MLSNKLFFSFLLPLTWTACSSDRNLEDPIRTIQNAQAMRDVNDLSKPRLVEETKISYPLPTASKTFEVRDFNVNETTGKVAFPAEVVYFEYDDATLTKAGQQQLDSLARYMQEHVEANLSIEGHCDHRGSVEYNLALGQRRSDSVRKYLGTMNVPYSRLDSVSFGKEKPAMEGDTEEALAKNRRVEFAFKNYASKTITKN